MKNPLRVLFKKIHWIKLAIFAGLAILLIGFGFQGVLAAGTYGTSLLQDPTAIRTSDKGAQTGLENLTLLGDLQLETDGQGWLDRKLTDLKNWARDDLWKELIVAGGSKALGSAVTSALNTIAYDTATWLGSGGEGQQPLFYTEGWGAYLSNIADNAAGTFLEQLGKNNGYAKFNLCQPSLNVKVRIGMGLIQYKRPKKPACTFSEMQKNWEQELSRKDFLERFQTMFNPTENEFGVALTLQTGMFEEMKTQTDKGLYTREEGQGFINKGTGIIADTLSMPAKSIAEGRLSQSNLLWAQGLQYTGHALTDAANVFINQLAITAFNNLISKLGGKNYTSPYANWNSLINNFSAGPDATIGGGIAATQDRLRKIIEPRFNVRGDYNILNELAACPTPDRSGPTNCVIEEKFRQAINEKKTVGEAMKLGYLNGDKVFGFSANGVEPRYIDGYPYRSMIILRKFRILPVGWEIGAQYIKDNIDPDKGGVGVKSLADMVACFDPNDEFRGYNDDGSQVWCRGLVDPDWVLKAPLNYCRREGPGPENISGDSLTMVRNDKYCGDEQSCIKEKNDGSCEYYGYCTGERRKWKFETESCDPIFNTCQTFKKDSGETVSYLQNTLDYAGCTIDNAGCADYCTAYDFGTGKYACTASSTGDKLFLDRDAASCDQAAEGCHEFIRAKDGLGANLLVNSSFEEDLAIGGWSALGATSSEAYSGQLGLVLKAGLSIKSLAVGPDISYAGGEYNIEGESYSLSFYAKNCAVGDTFALDDGANTDTVNLAAGADWQRYETGHIFMNSGHSFDLKFNVTAPGCIIDAIKLEKGFKVTGYDAYRQSGLIYEKFAPSYLGCDGVADPAECKDFARSCRAEEVGCELYTPTNGELAIPGRVKSSDYCVAECVGFDTYIQSQTTFDSLRRDYFIPKTAKSCSAELNGCDQFTNLDKLGSGAEATEYYSYLRQCVTSGGAQYYAWEGSDETGFQLKVVSLKPDDDGDDMPLDLDGDPATPDAADYVGDPAITGNRADEVLKCNEKIYQLKQTDPGYNPDCREYYNTAGQKSYHLYSQTISEDANCHPYRRTEVNIDPKITAAAACVGPDKHWDGANNQCAVCLNGGLWNDQQQACVYQAIPGQGAKCSAAFAGCREYTGNTGQNVKIISASDFEDSTTQKWSAAGGSTISLSTESITMGGHSLGVQAAAAGQGIKLPIDGLIKPDKAYAISLIAKTAAPVRLKAYFTNAAGDKADFNGLGALSADWLQYRANLPTVTITQPTELIIEADAAANFFVDDIKLTEVTDRFYLIKNSWQTPESCNQDINGNPYALYMLGCNEYKDRDNNIHYLKSFSYLCGEGSVGCELMIDTHNSVDSRQQKRNDGQAPAFDDVTVPADNFVYAVFDRTKQCRTEDKGCQRLGQPYSYQQERAYRDAYKINDPDNYQKIMCDYDALSCGEFAYDEGVRYFKDPGAAVCEWRPGSNNVYGWFKKKVKRCNGTGALCLDDKACAGGQTCSEETADKACPTDELVNPKTMGLGTGARINQPEVDNNGNRWVGLCPAEQSSCTELIEPLSQFNENRVFNNYFDQNINTANDGAQTYFDGWDQNKQNIKIEANSLFILAGKGPVGRTLSLGGCIDRQGVAANLSEFDPLANSLDASAAVMSLGLTPTHQSRLFYTNKAVSCTLAVMPLNVTIADTEVEVRKVEVDYQFAKGLDGSSCNGVVGNNINGLAEACVLFNKRAIQGNQIASTTYDADISLTAPLAGNPVDRDANVLLKVAPDRVCDQWLACETSVVMKNQQGEDQNICLDIGLCNQFDYKGRCANFKEKTPPANQTYNYGSGGTLNASAAANLSGYVKVGKGGEAYIPLGSMTQAGGSVNVYNGNMEMHGEKGYPTGWKFYNSKDVWDEKSFHIVSTPSAVQNEAVGGAPEGSSILKLGVKHEVVSNSFTIKNGDDYILQAQVNTNRLKGGNVIMKLACSGANVLATKVVAEGLPWTPVSTNLVNANCNSAEVRFEVVPTVAGIPPEGNYYVDDVKIKPALERRLAPSEYTSQSCRLYPETDSLSCQYQDSNGYRYNGWYGYCLEYDRYPGSSNACLLWWPVDKVAGDPFSKENTFKGYDGKYPAYYCAELDGNFRFVEKRSAWRFGQTVKRSSTFLGDVFNFASGFFSGGFAWVAMGSDVWGLSSFKNTTAKCPVGLGYTVKQTVKTTSNLFRKKTTITYYCVPSSRKYIVAGGGNDEWNGGAWYEFNGALINGKDEGGGEITTEITGGVRILDLSGRNPQNMALAPVGGVDGVLVDPNNYDYLPCKKFYETVNAVADNKVWLGRIAVDSNYRPLVLGYEYKQDDPAYGSAVPPEPQNNPYEWDSDAKPGRQPVQYKYSEKNESRSGSPYGCIGEKCGKVGYCQNSGKTCIKPSCENDICSGAAYGGSVALNQFAPNTPSICYTGATFTCVDQVVTGEGFVGLVADATQTVSDTDTYDEVDSNGRCLSVEQNIPAGFRPATTTVTCTAEVCTAGNGAGNDCQWGVPDQASSDPANRVVTWQSPQYSCDYNEACITTEPETGGDLPPKKANDAVKAGITAQENLKRMFAKNYGVWKWNPNTRHYEKDLDPIQNWDVNDAPICNRPRPNYPGDYCRILPIISNIKVDKNKVSGSDTVRLTFNTSVDVNQLPLVYIAIDWGDGSPVIPVTGEFGDRPNQDNPHVFYHSYSYSKFAGCAGNPCKAEPKIIIMDNWGTETAATSNPAPGNPPPGAWVDVFSN